MQQVNDVFSNSCLWCAVIAWIVAQGLKIPIHALTDHHWKVSYFWSAGGMPSSHTAGVMALDVMVGLNYGWGSVAFAISMVFSAIVMYDAAGVRRETGRQGAAINEILQKVMVEGKPISDDELKEVVGHSPFEVAMGAVTGILVAVLWKLILG